MPINEISVPSISLPKGGGAIKGIGENFQPDPFSGTANLSIPIYTSPGRDLQPELSLDYSSTSGNGIFGIGFAVSIPYISVKSEKGIPKYNDSDIFTLSTAGQLVPKLIIDDNGATVVSRHQVDVDGVAYTVIEYLPRFEGAFPKIEQWTKDTGESHWEVLSRDNLKSIYGKTENGRIADPDNNRRIFQWLLESTTDARGNQILYHYKEENFENVPRTIYEVDRSYTANKYIHSIKYGNYYDVQGSAPDGQKFAFEVVFDYGEYDLENPEAPPVQWLCRKDPFSSYGAGFEIRTFRLCRNVLMFHTFTGEFSGEPFLVRASCFEYEETPGMSFLKQVKVVGYRKDTTGAYHKQELPPLEFGYTPFEPTQQSFDRLIVEGGGIIPGGLAIPQYDLVDLYGEGIPGLLFSDDATTLYWEPRGNGVYSYPKEPTQFPIEKNLSAARYALMDVDSDGQLDLVVSNPPRAGFYKNNDDRSWQPYASFNSFPLEYTNPDKAMVDADGNGLTDLLFIASDYVRVYPSEGVNGFSDAINVPRKNEVPVTEAASSTYHLGFARMFGDGLQHRVKVRSGRVECWPNLGYGEFGNKVIFGNSPIFDGPISSSRLFFADLDGSGADDLILATPEAIHIYFNQSGNSFSDPVTIRLPEPFNDLSQITFSDVRGNGTSCLVFTTLDPEVSHYYYDFSGNIKPYLLDEINNNLGATTRVEYKSSTEYFLADQRAGDFWVTRLPFPVQVVSRVESIDQISGSKLVTISSYHDGYFDPVEREFRGFGFVERWDTEAHEDFSKRGLHKDMTFEGVSAELHTPAAYTKVWYHTGAYVKSGVLSKQFQEEYYKGDAGAYNLPDSTFDPTIYQGDSDTVRQAYVALKGQVIRQEVYGQDGKPGISENPYSVNEWNFDVRLVQPAHGYARAVFYVFGREAIEYVYERDPHDPRINQNFTLDVDSYGNVVQSCTVFYPRRMPDTETRLPADKIYPEQSELKSTIEVNHYINVAGEFRLLGVPCEVRSFQIGGLDLPPSGYFTLDELRAQVTVALQNQLSYGQPFLPGQLQARLYTWQKFYYWDQVAGEENPPAILPLCEVSPLKLLHNVETAVFPPELVASVYGDRVTPGMLADKCKYVLSDGYWWNPGLIQYYYTEPQNFYLPSKVENYLGGRTSVEYDPYRLAQTRVSQLVGLENGVEQTNTATARIDYTVMRPHQITDINGVISQALFDPLGFVFATSIHKTTGDKSVGDGNLNDYVVRSDATFQDVVITRPHYYLEEATTFFYYDLFAWMTTKSQPASSASLARETHVSDLPPGVESRIQKLVVYTDGFGRTIEEKSNADPLPDEPDGRPLVTPFKSGLADTSLDSEWWIVSGRTIYNNKGKPVKQYRPYYTTTPYYEPQNEVITSDVLPPPVVIHYDPLLRVIRTDTPKQFFTKTEYHSWITLEYDEDDTVKDSSYYREHINDDDPDFRDEKNALEKAAVFFNTPVESVLDNMGRTFVTIQINTEVSEDTVGWGYLTTHLVLDIESNPVEMIDPRQVRCLAQVFDMTGEPLSTISSDAGPRHVLNNTLGDPINTWDGRGFNIASTYDLLQRLVRVHVKGDGGNGLVLDQTVELVIYGESQPDSYAKNLRGQVYQYYDEAGVLYNDSYDIEGNLLETRRRLRADYKSEVDWNHDVPLDPEVYPTKYSYNALGNLTSEITPDGSNYLPQYTISGWPRQIDVTFADSSKQRFVSDALYNAQGQQLRVEYGNGAVTDCTYEWSTARLVTILTTRPSTAGGGDNRNPVVQNTVYTYDPVGNVTRVRDHTQQAVFCNQQEVPALSDYTYDAIYRLIEATGRQHPGIQADTFMTGFKQSLYMPLCPPPNVNDGEKLQVYKETYTYDKSGNLTLLRHTAPPPSPSWTRVVEVPQDSNRVVPAGSRNTTYDGNGNMLGLDNLRSIKWNFRNNISQADIIMREDNVSDSDYYVYDYSGNRVRKVSERFTYGGTIIQVGETIYLGNLVIYRNKRESEGGTATVLVRQSLHVAQGESCVAITNYWPQDDFKREARTVGTRKYRYQLTNALGSAAVEVDGDANVISYEEFFPYGGTSVIAGDDQAEVKLKDYRYVGKECDDTTGLYYYGARYYATWISRWISPDPSGVSDGLNLYEYVGSNPTSFADTDGRVKEWLMQLLRMKSQAPTEPTSESSPKPEKSVVSATQEAPKLLTAPQKPLLLQAPFKVFNPYTETPLKFSDPYHKMVMQVAQKSGIYLDALIDDVIYDKGSEAPYFTVDPKTGKRTIALDPKTLAQKSAAKIDLDIGHELSHSEEYYNLLMKHAGDRKAAYKEWAAAKFGSKAYAKEEVRVEGRSLMTTSRVYGGLSEEVYSGSKQYIKGWMSVYKSPVKTKTFKVPKASFKATPRVGLASTVFFIGVGVTATVAFNYFNRPSKPKGQ